MHWSQAELANAMGRSRHTVTRLMKDGRRTLDAGAAFALQDKTGFCARWVALGQGPAHIDVVMADEFPEMANELRRHAHEVVAILRRLSKQKQDTHHR